MDTDPQEFLESAAPLLGWCYLALGALNAGAAWRSWRRATPVGRCKTDVKSVLPLSKSPYRRPAAWLGFALLWAALGSLAFAGRPVELPTPLEHAIDAGLGPATLFVGSLSRWRSSTSGGDGS